MEIKVKVIDILPEHNGTSAAGNAWKTKTFIAETLEQVVRNIAFEIFGEQRIKDNPVGIGNVYNVSFDLESRQFNGRWYTNAKAWKVVPAQDMQQDGNDVEEQQQAMQQQPATFEPQPDPNGLPF